MTYEQIYLKDISGLYSYNFSTSDDETWGLKNMSGWKEMPDKIINTEHLLGRNIDEAFDGGYASKMINLGLVIKVENNTILTTANDNLINVVKRDNLILLRNPPNRYINVLYVNHDLPEDPQYMGLRLDGTMKFRAADPFKYDGVDHNPLESFLINVYPFHPLGTQSILLKSGLINSLGDISTYYTAPEEGDIFWATVGSGATYKNKFYKYESSSWVVVDEYFEITNNGGFLTPLRIEVQNSETDLLKYLLVRNITTEQILVYNGLLEEDKVLNINTLDKTLILYHDVDDDTGDNVLYNTTINSQFIDLDVGINQIMFNSVDDVEIEVRLFWIDRWL